MKKYRPSNGCEGDWFLSNFCSNCIHGKFEHTGDIKDNPCEIASNSMLFDLKDKEYPEEWQYDEKGEPTCTAFVKWDWNRDNDGNWIDPPPQIPDDPNQLCMPFLFDEIGVKQLKEEPAMSAD